MAKTKISEYSSTASSNTDINSINIDEGCSPSGINNAIRTLMAQLKDFQVGSAGDPLTVGGNLSTGGNLSVTGTTALTGSATAPTPSTGDNSTKIATTAFVAATNTALGLGTMATQNANAVTISGGTASGLAISGATITTSTVGGLTVGTNATGTKTISSSSPTGGSDGDVWYQI